MYMYILGKATALGVLCCFALFVCLTLLASFFLLSHLSFKNMYMQVGRKDPVLFPGPRLSLVHYCFCIHDL